MTQTILKHLILTAGLALAGTGVAFAGSIDGPVTTSDEFFQTGVAESLFAWPTELQTPPDLLAGSRALMVDITFMDSVIDAVDLTHEDESCEFCNGGGLVGRATDFSTIDPFAEIRKSKNGMPLR